MVAIEPEIEPVDEPVAVAWLDLAVELEELAIVAQSGKWTEAQENRALELPHLIAGLMETDATEPEQPPTIPPEPTTPPDPITLPGEKLPRRKHPPPAARELKANPSTLMNVVRNTAQPGDHILLEDGDYGAGYNFDKPFPPERPLVIRSRTPMGANFTVAARFTAPGYWLHEVRTSYERGTSEDSYNVKAEANHLTFTRCWFQGRDAIASRSGAISHLQVGWCRFTGRNKHSSTSTHLYVWLPNSGSYNKPTDGPNNISIHRNFFDDPTGAAAEDHHIYFGHTKAGKDDLPMMYNVFIDYNYWAKTSKRTRPLYMKRGCVIRRNTCLSTERNFGVRHGKQSVVWANIVKPSFFHFGGALVVGGTPDNFHDIRGNEAPNSSLILFCGSETAAKYQAASFATAASNNVKSIEVGLRQGGSVSPANGGLTKGCKIYLDGKLPKSAVHLLSCVRDTITVRDDDGGLTIPKTDPLTETDVGLETAGQGNER